ASPSCARSCATTAARSASATRPAAAPCSESTSPARRPCKTPGRAPMPTPTLILTDPRFLAHEAGIGHPESPARLRAILSDLERARPDGVVFETPRAATAAEIEAVHSHQHRALLESLAGKRVRLDPDTAMTEGSWEAAALAAGAAVGAVEAVWSGRAANAFAL